MEMTMGDNTCNKRRGKKDRATAEAVTRKHKARRAARNAKWQAACESARVVAADAGITHWRHRGQKIGSLVRRIRRGERIAKAVSP
jgi:hypothetical protein